MSHRLFDSQIADLRARIDALSKIAEGDGAPLGQAVAGLQAALEELSAAQEELLQQNQELRSAQAAIEEERHKYQELFDSTPDAYLTTDLAGIIQTANRTAAGKLGWSAESLAGWPLANLVAKEDRQAFRAAMAQLGKGHDAQEWTVRLQPPKAPAFDAAIRAVPVRHGRGAATGLRWLLRDITDQKRQQEATQQREQSKGLIHLLDLANVFVRDPDNRVVRWNEACRQLYGYEESDALGRVSHELLDTRFPEPRENIRAKLLENGRWEGELNHRRRDGSRLTVASVWVLDRDAQGQPGAIVEINADITDRQRAEPASQVDTASPSSPPAHITTPRVPEKGITPVGPIGQDKPSTAVSVLIFVSAVAIMAYLRLYLFEDRFITLTYGLPLLLCLWHQDRRLLWSMAASFLGISALKAFWLMPDPNPNDFVELTQWLMQATNTVVIGGTVEAILRLTRRMRESERRFETLAAATFEGIAVTENGRYTDANDQMLAMLGFSRQELLGREVASDIPAEVRGEVLTDLRAGRESHAEHPFVRKDGTRIIVEAHGRTIDYQNRKVRFTAIRDITERKRAEEALRRKEADLRDAQRVAHIGSWQWDAKTDVTTGSDELLRIYGLDPVTQRMPDFKVQRGRCYPVEDWERVNAAVQETLRTGAGYELDVQAIRGGTRIWVTTRGEAVQGADGQIVGLRGTVQDITERKRAEEALRESEERFRVAQELSPDGFAILRPVRDSEGRIVDFTFVYENAAIARINGTDPAAVVGRRVSEFLPAHSQSPFHVAHAHVADTGEACIMEHKYDGGDIPRPTWFRVVVVRTGQDIAILSQDITERKRAEEAVAAAHRQVQSIIDNTTSIIYAFDLEERFLLANTALAEVLKSTPEQMIGKRRHEFMPKEDADWHEANDRKAIEAGRALEFEECSQLAGRTITWLTTKFPLRDAQGRIYAVAGISTDVSDRKKAEEELKSAKLSAEQAKAAAESASRAKDQFIAVLSHELRTPLTPALAAVSMMEGDMRLPGETREDLAMVRRNIAVEVRLIADLLDVSRIISGKLHLERRPMDVAAAIREAAQIVSGDLDAKGQTLTIETPEPPYLTFGDAARLQQVFWNLLRNATKFTPHRGQIAIRASVAHVDHCPLAAQPCPVGMGVCPLPQASEGDGQPCGGNLIIEVSDNGSGIAPDMLPRLFNAFEQGQEARTFGGLGLGLSICKAVVDMHGGTIAVQSDGLGKGATFTLRLPIAQCPLAAAREGSPAAADETQTAGGNGKPAAPEQPRAIRILLVEDHPDTAKLMSRLLMADGHEVTVADSVAAGLAAVEQAAGKLDLLISDLGLPDGTGHDLMRRLREQGNAISGIALSGYGAAADIEQSKGAGFAEHLVKPINPDLIAAAIQRVTSYRNLVNGGGG